MSVAAAVATDAAAAAVAALAIDVGFCCFCFYCEQDRFFFTESIDWSECMTLKGTVYI